MKKVGIIVVDDHALVRASLKSLIAQLPHCEVLAEAGDGETAIQLTTLHRPDVLLMDISMPLMDGIKTTAHIVKKHPGTRILVLSMHADQEHVLTALRAGASGYILKSSPSNELALAIETVAKGQMYLSPSISGHVVSACLDQTASPRSPLDLLSPRQRETLQLIAEGHPSRRIAQLLGASVKTIESHRASLMSRLDIHDIAGLVRFAVRNGIISSEA